jgi:hypothetical protein
MTSWAVPVLLAGLGIACTPRPAGGPPDATEEASRPSAAPAPTASVAAPETAPSARPRDDAGVDLARLCREVANAIAAVKPRYAQLAAFDPARAVTAAEPACHIDYTFRCHPARHHGGWSSAVPNPDDDGVWFYLGIWDPDDPSEAGSQINTQPVLPNWTIAGRRITFLILNGAHTKPLGPEIEAILRRRGMQ